MSEFWVSRDKYFCKYCKIYIADDKPSRSHHDSGFRHKGNYERYIRDIYKKGAMDKKEKAEEAFEIARMEAAAHSQMLASGEASTSTLPVAAAPKVSTKPAKPADPFANYSTAADLGYVDPDADRLEAEASAKESRQLESTVGTWQKVVKRPVVLGEEERKREAQRLEDEEAQKEWEERRKAREAKYLNEKQALVDDGEFDPTKVEFKLKRKRLTLKEEEAERIKKEEEEAEAKRERKKKRRETTTEGWAQVEAKEEEFVDFFDTPAEDGESEAKPEMEGEESKPKIEEDTKPTIGGTSGGGFKKRKMHGAGAVRKK